ncbi:MAG: hypothetical protein WA459_20950 [Stellaceae bacterium]
MNSVHPATSDDALAAIRARRDTINIEIVQHRDAMAGLEAEIVALEAKRRELDIAERVLIEIERSKFSNYVVDDKLILEIDRPKRRGRPPGPPREKKKRANKPSSLPSYPEMINDALLIAHDHGFNGLEPVEIIGYIQKRYWPEAVNEAIAPVISGMGAQGRLVKYGTLYRIPAIADAADALRLPQTEAEELEQRARRREWLAQLRPTFNSAGEQK